MMKLLEMELVSYLDGFGITNSKMSLEATARDRTGTMLVSVQTTVNEFIRKRGSYYGNLFLVLPCQLSVVNLLQVV